MNPAIDTLGKTKVSLFCEKDLKSDSNHEEEHTEVNGTSGLRMFRVLETQVPEVAMKVGSRYRKHRASVRGLRLKEGEFQLNLP